MLASDAMAVYDCMNGQMEVIDEETTESTMLEAYENVSTHMSTFNVSASVEAEYYAKVSASTSLTLVDSSVTTIRNAITRTLSQKHKTTLTLDRNEARMLVGAINIWQDAEGNTWYSPTTAPNWAVIQAAKYGGFAGYYDLSSNASIITGLTRTTDPATKFCKLGSA